MNPKNTREIERKFLVKRLPSEVKRARRYRIAQGYLAAEPDDRHVRLRRKGTTRSLTFKTVDGSVREEREIQLSDQQFRALWPGTRGRRLRKVRYEISWNDVLIELDIYRGKNNGLIVAEVEFPNRTACRKFKPPGWLGREVTGEKRYSNIQLACE